MRNYLTLALALGVVTFCGPIWANKGSIGDCAAHLSNGSSLVQVYTELIRAALGNGVLKLDSFKNNDSLIPSYWHGDLSERTSFREGVEAVVSQIQSAGADHLSKAKSELAKIISESQRVSETQEETRLETNYVLNPYLAKELDFKQWLGPDESTTSVQNYRTRSGENFWMATIKDKLTDNGIAVIWGFGDQLTGRMDNVRNSKWGEQGLYETKSGEIVFLVTKESASDDQRFLVRIDKKAKKANSQVPIYFPATNNEKFEYFENEKGELHVAGKVYVSRLGWPYFAIYRVGKSELTQIKRLSFDFEPSNDFNFKLVRFKSRPPLVFIYRNFYVHNIFDLSSFESLLGNDQLLKIDPNVSIAFETILTSGGQTWLVTQNQGDNRISAINLSEKRMRPIFYDPPKIHNPQDRFHLRKLIDQGDLPPLIVSHNGQVLTFAKDGSPKLIFVGPQIDGGFISRVYGETYTTFISKQLNTGYVADSQFNEIVTFKTPREYVFSPFDLQDVNFANTKTNSPYFILRKDGGSPGAAMFHLFRGNSP